MECFCGFCGFHSTSQRKNLPLRSTRHGAVAAIAALQRTSGTWSAASSSAGSEQHSWVLKELKEPMGTPSVFFTFFCWFPTFFLNMYYTTYILHIYIYTYRKCVQHASICIVCICMPCTVFLCLLSRCPTCPGVPLPWPLPCPGSASVACAGPGAATSWPVEAPWWKLRRRRHRRKPRKPRVQAGTTVQPVVFELCTAGVQRSKDGVCHGMPWYADRERWW